MLPGAFFNTGFQKEIGEDAIRLPCIAEVHEWQKIEGVAIPKRLDITWIIDGKPFTWYKFTVEEAKFNPRVPDFW